MELMRSTSRGGFFVRSIFSFVTAVVITVLLVLASSVTPVHAADPEANWKGESIMYDGHQYYASPEAKTGESHGLAQGTHYYVYVEQISERPLVQKAHVIYFAPGADPPVAASATHVVYDFSATKEFSNPQGQKTIVITPQGESDQYESSCSVDGIGWIICPVSVFLAESMDWIFDVLSSMIAVQPPVTGDSNSDLYVAWNVMRSFANIAFIIVFLIIIYSQLTNLGLSNYGLKKLIPRLIIAAILVNLSFYICAIAVDISNIAGYSLQDILVQIRQDTFNIDNDTWSAEATDWKSVTAFVLSGGTAAVIGISLATAGEPAAAIALVLPLLIGLLLTLLFVLLVLAARQAIIIILIVVAPLAFVAYLLPNTEKWFERWRELFMTMLIFFPAFSLVFGGSQLAGGIIIQNATSIVTMIFGMAVQVAPLVITPLLLKLSGSLLGKIAGIINDPRKGLLDRSRNWAKERSEMHRLESLDKPGGANLFRRVAQRMDNGNQRTKERTAVATLKNTNRYERTPGHRELHRQTAIANAGKETMETELNAALEAERNVAGSAYNLATLELEDRKTDLEEHQESTKGMITEFRAGEYDGKGNARISALQREMAGRLVRTSGQKQRTITAQFEQQRIISTGIKNNDFNSLDIAQGIGGENARSRAMSSAVAAINKLKAEAQENALKLMAEEAATRQENMKQHTERRLREVMAGTASLTDEELGAALQAQVNEKNMPLFEELLGSVNIDETILSRIISDNAGVFKGAGGYHMQANLQMNAHRLGEDGYAEALKTGHIDTLSGAAASGFKDFKMGELEVMSASIDKDIVAADALGPKGEKGLRLAYNNLRDALRNEDVRTDLGDRLDEMHQIEAALAARFHEEPTKDTRVGGTGKTPPPPPGNFLG